MSKRWRSRPTASSGLRLFVERENANAQATYEALGMKDEGYRLFYARTDGRE